MKLLLLISMLFILNSCAIGPLVQHETARTVGKSSHELIAGYGTAGHALKWNYGLGKNFDLGIHWESLSIGLRAKYAFMQSQDKGLAIASVLGTGSSLGGDHYYAELIFSYLTNKFEPYFSTRIVQVTNDPIEFRDKNTGELNFDIKESKYKYGQLIAGSRYWINPKLSLSFEASSIFVLQNTFGIDQHLLLSAALAYRI